MNRRMTISAACAVALLLLTTARAPAQGTRFGRPGFTPYPRPALNPYLNLLRGGDPASNFFLGVVPEQSQRAINRQFGSAIQELEQGVTDRAPAGDSIVPRLGDTGHPTAFQSFGPYYTFPRTTRSTQLPGANRR